MARRRKTESIGDVGRDILAKLDPHGKRHESKAVQVWPEVAGSEIVKHTRGFAMREGELVVFVDSPAWANELTLMAERLREGINSRIGQNSVRGIRFAVSKKVQEERHREALHLEDEEFYQPDRTKPVALSTEELDQARYIAEAVREPELREKALRVMIKDLEWKKGVRDTKEAERATGGPRDTGSSPS